MHAYYKNSSNPLHMQERACNFTTQKLSAIALSSKLSFVSIQETHVFYQHHDIDRHGFLKDKGQEPVV